MKYPLPSQHSARGRRGAVLILVVGMTAMLAALSAVFLLRMRSDAEDSGIVGREVQARLMYHAGLMYLQESSILGWGPDVKDPAAAFSKVPGSMTFGWTDLRNGSLGPRGQREQSSAPIPTASDGLPIPTWWQGSFGAYVPSPLDAELPTPSRRRWPCPGSAVRIGMGVPIRTPYAIRGTVAPNALVPPPTFPIYGDPAWETTEWGVGADQRIWPSTWTETAYRTNGADAGTPAALDPQPVEDTWEKFKTGERLVNGELAITPGSESGWFRIYREVLADHDCDGSPAYDLVALHDPAAPALKNWNVFIVACGSGPTHGFRFWNLAQNDPRRALEPVTAQESGYWADESLFQILRSEERILWYRVEWTGQNSGALANNRDAFEWLLSDGTGSRNPTRSTLPNLKGGSFVWIQSLASEPENW